MNTYMYRSGLPPCSGGGDVPGNNEHGGVRARAVAVGGDGRVEVRVRGDMYVVATNLHPTRDTPHTVVGLLLGVDLGVHVLNCNRYVTINTNINTDR